VRALGNSSTLYSTQLAHPGATTSIQTGQRPFPFFFILFPPFYSPHLNYLAQLSTSQHVLIIRPYHSQCRPHKVRLSETSHPSTMWLLTNRLLVQIRGRACDQYPEGDEYRGDGAKTQTCTKLYRVHVGSQVFGSLLGGHESVSLFLLNASRKSNWPSIWVTRLDLRQLPNIL
jgi:hypothetical protein